MEDSRLEKFLKTGEKIDLGNLFNYLQGIAEGLSSIVRWEAREKIAGQSVRENDLQHTFKVAFMTIVLTVMENEKRQEADKLNMGTLALMALVHDMGEITEGDMAYFLKLENSRKKDADEFRSFCRIISPLPEQAQQCFTLAMRQTLPGDKNHLDTKEARFFSGIERLMGLKRILHECRQGNLHFSPKSIELDVPYLKRLSEEFPSLENICDPYVREIEDYFKQFTKEREKYLLEFIKRGGKAEDFPF